MCNKSTNVSACNNLDNRTYFCPNIRENLEGICTLLTQNITRDTNSSMENKNNCVSETHARGY